MSKWKLPTGLSPRVARDADNALRKEAKGGRRIGNAAIRRAVEQAKRQNSDDDSR